MGYENFYEDYGYPLEGIKPGKSERITAAAAQSGDSCLHPPAVTC